MASKKLLTIFAATGNQGSSVIDTVLSHSEVASKYKLRGVTRNTQSAKSQALSARGVEMVAADLNDSASITAAVQGSYAVFVNTDYWTLLDKQAEINQGKNVFEACKQANVHHVVLSTLPNVTQLSGGKYTRVFHFDSKASVAEYAEAHKGSMKVSYFLPAMYMENIKMSTSEADGTTYISLPYPDIDLPWPMISPSRDTGNYVVGLLEAGDRADGISVQGVSSWTTPREVAKILGQRLGKKVVFNSIEPKIYEQYLPENVRDELSEMMQWIGEASYYGKGSENKQPESDQWLLAKHELTSWKAFANSNF